jgi:uncharacterized membrane protein HdeD (DUF308 family)
MSEDFEWVPTWVRALDVIFGIIAMILGIIILTSAAFPAGFLTELLLIWFVGIALILFGLVTFIRGFIMKGLSAAARFLYIIGGIIIIVLGALAFTAPLLTELLIILLMAIAVFIYGVILIIRGLLDTEAKGGRRFLAFIIGLFLIGISIPAMIYWTTWGVALLLIFLGITLIIWGLFRILIGLTAEIY